MRIRTFVIGCVAMFSVMGTGASNSQAANVANLEFQIYDSSMNLYWAPCELSFDRSAWSGGGGSWSSIWTNFAEISGDCVTDEWDSDMSMAVTKTPLSSGVGTFQADVHFNYARLSGFITCSNGGTVNGYWVNQPGSPNQKRFIFPASGLPRLAGGVLCANPVQIRSDTAASDVLVDY